MIQGKKTNMFSEEIQNCRYLYYSIALVSLCSKCGFIIIFIINPMRLHKDNLCRLSDKKRKKKSNRKTPNKQTKPQKKNKKKKGYINKENIQGHHQVWYTMNSCRHFQPPGKRMHINLDILDLYIWQCNAK